MSNKEKNRKQFDLLLENIETLDIHVNTNASIFQCGKIQSDKNTITSDIIFKECCSTSALLDSDAKRKAVLIFASGTRHGGGVYNGAEAQEEAISRVSSWMKVKIPDEYFNFSYPYYGHQFLAADGFFLYNANFIELPAPVKCKFVSCAAINYRIPNHGVTDSKSYEVISERIFSILQYCNTTYIDDFIVGAWGCGVFEGNPEIYAHCWKDALAKSGYSGRITFAIPDNNLLNVFRGIIQPGE